MELLIQKIKECWFSKKTVKGLTRERPGSCPNMMFLKIHFQIMHLRIRLLSTWSLKKRFMNHRFWVNSHSYDIFIIRFLLLIYWKRNYSWKLKTIFLIFFILLFILIFLGWQHKHFLYVPLPFITLRLFEKGIWSV